MSRNSSLEEKEILELLERIISRQHFWSSSTPPKIEDQCFGMQLDENDFKPDGDRCNNFSIRDRKASRKADSGFSEVTIDEGKFELKLDVRPFKIGEIRVSVTPNHFVKIRGNHDMRFENNGDVARSFTRYYCLPHGSNPKTIESTFRDGILKVVADVEAVANGSQEPGRIRLNLDAYQNYEAPASEKPEDRNVPIVSGELDSSDVVATVKKTIGSLLKMGVGIEDVDKIVQVMKAASLEDASKIDSVSKAMESLKEEVAPSNDENA